MKDRAKAVRDAGSIAARKKGKIEMPQARQRRRAPGSLSSAIKIKGIDLFCGAGGLTRGLEAAGIDIVTGVDIDPACEYPFTANNRATFLLKSVEDIGSADFADTLKDSSLTLLQVVPLASRSPPTAKGKPVQPTSDGIC
jgi:hypothetical protein